VRELAGFADHIATAKTPLKVLKEAQNGPIAACANPQPDWVAPENITRVGGFAHRQHDIFGSIALTACLRLT
jgi:hypothetical protein